MASERWNPTGEATFEHVRFSLNGVLQTLRFHEFYLLPVDERVRILLEGKPSFWLEGLEVARAKALARKLRALGRFAAAPGREPRRARGQAALRRDF